MVDWLTLPYDAVVGLVDEGGPFVVWIFICGLVMWTLVFERFWYFKRLLPNETAIAIKQWESRADHLSWCARSIREAMVSRLNAGMTAYMPVLRVLVPLAPLLGLIGTVSGMLEVFDSMAIRGSADARTMASGISHAMICTLSGLAVSITGLPFLAYFNGQAKLRTDLLWDQFKF